MGELYRNFKEKIEFVDKFLLILIIVVPFLLATSIFLADLACSISGIILIYIFFKKKIIFFRIIRTEIILMVVFYLIIIISLLFTKYFEHSFLASFFYFRYFLVSLSIFYLLKKYDFFITIFSYSLMFTLLIVLMDALIQYFYGSNLFGYDWPGRYKEDSVKIITGFFNDEKKLGSYLVRFLPLLLAVIYWHERKKNDLLSVSLILLVGIIIFLTSERTALTLYFIVCTFYFFISKNKFKFISCIILIFACLFYTHPPLKAKFIKFTMNQMQGNYSGLNDKNGISLRYYSYEHENLVYTSIKIFQENFLIGSGVKSFQRACFDLKKDKLKQVDKNKRQNKLVCSTHPHSTYFQILSDIGFFGFIFALYILYYIISIFSKFAFKIYKNDKINISYYFINVGVLVSIFPLIPSGNIFNNWISLILFYLLGFWLYLKKHNVLKKMFISRPNKIKK